MFVCVDTDCPMLQDESNIITAMLAGWKFFPKHAGNFMLICVAGVVKDAIDSRPLTFISRFEYIPCARAGHTVILFSGRVFWGDREILAKAEGMRM